MEAYDHLLKVILIGEAGVGKSSILLRFTDDRFTDDPLSTIGVDLKVKPLEMTNSQGERKRIKVTLWDTAGQERFRTLTASYFHGLHAVIIVYDVTRRETFDKLPSWVEEVDRNTHGPVVRVLVGNKVDQAESRQVTRKEGELWAQERGMMFVESSAKTKHGVQQVFMECFRQVLDSSILLQQGHSKGAKSLVDNNSENAHLPSQEKQGSCCST